MSLLTLLLRFAGVLGGRCKLAALALLWPCRSLIACGLNVQRAS